MQHESESYGGIGPFAELEGFWSVRVNWYDSVGRIKTFSSCWNELGCRLSMPLDIYLRWAEAGAM